MKRVWITRASPGADETAARVRALGFGALVAPLLRVRSIPGARIDLDGVGALAFTSANAVAAFAALSPVRALPVFAVGAATARAAWDQGFSRITSADGDVAGLARLLQNQPPLAGAILHAGPAEPAGDLVGDLNAHDIPARAVAIYETIASPPDAASVDVAALDAVFLHSPKAARILADFLGHHPAPGLRAFCLSPAVARPLAGASVGPVEAAAEPTEAALLSLLAARLAPKEAGA